MLGCTATIGILEHSSIGDFVVVIIASIIIIQAELIATIAIQATSCIGVLVIDVVSLLSHRHSFPSAGGSL